jgi:hypothetical protein
MATDWPLVVKALSIIYERNREERIREKEEKH